MKVNNMYGFVSGGYLFDIMDRYALDKLIEKYGDGYYFTSDAEITYLKQCCDEKDIILESPNYGYLGYGYGIIVYAKSKTSDIIYAKARFTFVKKDHNYCEQ